MSAKKAELTYVNRESWKIPAQYGDDVPKLPPVRTTEEYDRDKALGINVGPTYTPPYDGRKTS